MELVPVASSFPCDPTTGAPRLPSLAVALSQFIFPFFHSHNFMPFTRESIISIPYPNASVSSSSSSSSSPPPTLWKIVSLSPSIGGLVTGRTHLTVSQVSTGMSRAEYMKRQETEDAEYALLVQKQQAIQCVDEAKQTAHMDEWAVQQRVATQLKGRLAVRRIHTLHRSSHVRSTCTFDLASFCLCQCCSCSYRSRACRMIIDTPSGLKSTNNSIKSVAYN
jgi:hypothetical protein